MGMGSLLWCAAPGVKFCASDLARNLVLSAFAAAPLAEQEAALQALWLAPIQLPVGSARLDALLAAFLDARDAAAAVSAGGGGGGSGGAPALRHVSAFEARVHEFAVSPIAQPRTLGGIMLYARVRAPPHACMLVWPRAGHIRAGGAICL